MILRIVWATRQKNVRIAIAANIFLGVGVILVFTVNVLFAQRIVRACHPHAGWHAIFHWAFMSIYTLILITLCILVTVNIQTFYTLNHNTKRIDRDLLLYSQTYYVLIGFLPVPLVIGGLVLPRRTRVEKFGQGRFRTKVAILLTASLLLCLGAAYRVGVNYAGGLRSRDNPANYQGKTPFYIFNFGVEIIVIYLYALVRVDKRFFVPNQSHKPGDYSRRGDYYDRRSLEKVMTPDSAGLRPLVLPEIVRGSSLNMILSEEEVFDDMTPEELEQSDMERQRAADEEKTLEQQHTQYQTTFRPLSALFSEHPTTGTRDSMRPLSGLTSEYPTTETRDSIRPLSGFSFEQPNTQRSTTVRPISGISFERPTTRRGTTARPVSGISFVRPDLRQEESTRPLSGTSFAWLKPALQTPPIAHAPREFIELGPDSMEPHAF